MPRIRTIKPEFWSDGKIIRASIGSRLLFIGIWNFSDDHGVMINDPFEIKAKIFPADDLDISKMINELAAIGLITKYEDEGQKYFIVNKFLDHQVIDRPRKTTLPLPDECTNQLKSIEINRPSAKGKERKGKERKGIKNIGDKSPSESKANKLKAEIESLILKFKAAWKKEIPFYSEKYRDIDLIFQWENIEDWVRRKPSKARESAKGNLNLFFQRWLNKEKPSFKKSPKGYPAHIVTNEELNAAIKKRKAERLMEIPEIIERQKRKLLDYEEGMKGDGLDDPSIKRMKEIPGIIKSLEEEMTELQGES